MSDIIKCTNYDCELADSCKRFQSISDIEFQSYQRFEPKYDEVLDEIECDFYIPKTNAL